MNPASATTPTTIDVQKFQGGRGWMVRAGIVGVLGMFFTVAVMLMGGPSAREAAYSYLIAFCYWVGIAFSSLILLMIFHTFHAKWMTVLRRPIEAMAGTLPFFVLLFIPIALRLGDIYLWVDPPMERLTVEERHLIHHKHGYLNPAFFFIRTGIYFLVGIFLAQRLFGLSTRQDAATDPTVAANLLVKQRRLSAGGMPFLALAFSFAAFDWMMTLNPFWFSTIFGVYFFAGSFLSTLCIIVIVTTRARGRDLYGEFVTVEHTHNLGKLMLGFTAFWAYIGFSQFMLIWIANLPEETPFFTVRMSPGWMWMFWFLAIGHFAVPFLLLLSRKLKRRPHLLAVVGFWQLFMNFVDLYWLIIPTISPTGVRFHWTLVTVFLGVGGLAIAAAIWRIRGHFTIPVRDPFLANSLAYKQP